MRNLKCHKFRIKPRPLLLPDAAYRWARRGTFLVAALVEVGAAGMAALLLWRTRRRYAGVTEVAPCAAPNTLV